MKLSQPANPGSPVNNLSQVINPGGSYTFNLSTQDKSIPYKTFLETTDGGPKNSGLLITSTGPITAYYEVGRSTSIAGNTVDTADYNGEIFSLKGNNALGKHFFTPFQSYFPNITVIGGKTVTDVNSSIDVIATEDNTTIKFTLKTAQNYGQARNGTKYYNIGQTDSIKLNKGQTYTFIATSPDGGAHMTGSEITSNKPIAVTQKDDSVNPWWDKYAADILGDQLVPVDIVGTEYIVVRGFLQQRNSVFIVATQPNTKITFHADNSTQTLAKPGDLSVHDLTDNNPNSLYAEQITADKPVYVYYVSGYVSEFGGPLLPPINCTGSQELSFVRSSSDPFFLTVLVRTEGIANFLVDGQKGVINATDFVTVGSGWSAAQKRMDALTLPTGIPLNTGINVENTTSYFHLGIINGQVNKTARFGYFSNYNKITSQLPTTTALCPTSTVLLDPKVLGADSSNTKWYLLPDVTNPVHIGPRYEAPQTGKYRLSLVDKNQCIYIDTVTVVLNSVNPFDLGKNADTICFNVNNPITVNGSWNSIQWTKLPQGVTVPDQTASYSPKKSGVYEVTVKDKGGCSQKDQVSVTYSDSTSILDLGADQKTVCYNVANPIKINGGPYAQILWTAPENVPAGTQSYNPKTSGLYKVTVKDYAGCSNSDQVNVNFDNTLSKFDMGDSTRNICANGSPLVVAGGPYSTIVWDAPKGVSIPDNTTSFKPIIGGVYKVTVTNSFNCSNSDQVSVITIDSIKADLGKDSMTSCGIQRLVLKPSKGDYGFTWSNNAGVNIPEGTAAYQPDKTGLYKVKVYNKDYPQCFSQDSIFVVFSPDIDLDFKGDSTASCFNANFKLCSGAGYAKYDWKPAALVPSGTKECYSPTVSGKYTLTITDRFNCKKSDSIYVKYYNKIDLGLHGGDTASCFPYNNYVVRIPHGYAKYEWTPAVSKDSLYTPAFNGKTTEKYKVKVTNADGCFDSDSITVSFVPEIQFPNIKGGDTVACEYAKFTIHAGPDFARYEWVNHVAGLHDSIFVPNQSGDYYVTVFTKRGGCSDTSATSHVIFAPDRVIDLGGPITHCKNSDPDTLHAGIGFDRYIWNSNPANNKEFFVPPFPKFSNGVQQDTMFLTAFYQKVCHTEASKIISFIKNDSLSLGASDTTVCPGEPVTMSAGEGFLGYSWISSEWPDSTLSEMSSVTVTRPALYTVYVSSNCFTAPAFKAIYNYTKPDATVLNQLASDKTHHFSKSDTINFCYTDNAILMVPDTTEKKNKYTWYDPSGNVLENLNLINIQSDGKYKVEVKDEHGCISVNSVTVMTNDSCFKIPNLVTANNDSQNDAFKIAGIRMNVWNVEIYNRWGERIYECKGYKNDWKADNVSDGVYYYYLENPNNDKKYKGWLQVIKNGN